MLVKCYGYSTFDTKPLYLGKNLWNMKISQLRSSFLFFFNLVVFAYSLFLEYTSLVQMLRISKRYLASSGKKSTRLTYLPQLLRITLRKTKVSRFYGTSQRAPMAHRQWSQEQYGFSFYKFTFVARLYKLNPTLVLTSPLFSFMALPDTFIFNSSFFNFFKLVTSRNALIPLG